MSEMKQDVIAYSRHKEIVEDIKAQQRYMFDTKSAQDERTIKRLWITILVIFFAFVATNAGWIIYENQFEDITIEQEGSTDQGGSNYFNGTGELNIYGEGETDYQNPQAEGNGQQDVPNV